MADSKVRTIVVTGEGAASAAPDRCVIYVDLNAKANSAATALDRVATVARSVIDDLKEPGSADGDVRTINISVNPFFDNESHQVEGHVVTYQMSILTRSVDGIGAVLNRLVEIAGDHLQIQRFELTTSDTKNLQTQARRQAVLDAAEKASEIADSAGLALGPVLEVRQEPDVDPTRFRRPRSFSLAAASAAVPIEVGAVSVSEQVTITYQIDA